MSASWGSDSKRFKSLELTKAKKTQLPPDSHKILLGYDGAPFFMAPEIYNLKNTDKEELLNPF